MNKTLICTAGLMLGAIAICTQPAAARIVCNAYGDCWHANSSYNYDHADRGFHAQYHPDDWYFHQSWNNDRDHHWRDYHDGRGYYKNGVWLSF